MSIGFSSLVDLNHPIPFANDSTESVLIKNGPNAARRTKTTRRRKAQERLRIILFRLLLFRDGSSSSKRTPTISIEHTPTRTDFALDQLATHSTKSDSDIPAPKRPKLAYLQSSFRSHDATSKVSLNFTNQKTTRPPLNRPKPTHRYSTYCSDDAQSRSYSSDTSDSSSTTSPLTIRKGSLTSHDSGFFEALEFCPSKLLPQTSNPSRTHSPTRSTSSTSTCLARSSKTITPTQFHALTHQLTSLHRSLARQEGLTSRFSTNLAHLFAEKEQHILCLKSVSDDCKERVIVALTRLRYLVGKALVRKIVLCKRDATILTFLQDQLSLLDLSSSSDSPNCDDDASPHLDFTTLFKPLQNDFLDSEFSPTSNSNSNPNPNSNGTTWNSRKIDESLKLLREDLEMQKVLDEALREGILGPVKAWRYYKMAVQERVQMKQFERFVEGSLLMWMRCYERLEGGLGRFEGVLVV